MAVLQGTVNAKLEIREKCASFELFFRTYAARLDLYFPYDGELRTTFPDPQFSSKGPNQGTIQAPWSKTPSTMGVPYD